MKKLTHIVGGILAAEALIAISGNAEQHDYFTKIVVIAGAAAGSIMPDIDHPDSTISKKFPLFRLLFLLVTCPLNEDRHRGIMHSFLAILPWIVAIISGPFILHDLFIGILLGYISHIILDCLTPQGCPLFLPFKKQIIIGGYIQTGSVYEIVFTIAMIFISICGISFIQ